MFQGTPFWRFIHFFALHDTGRDLLKDVVQFLPEMYVAEWEAPTEKEDLIEWSLRFHNRVNAKKGDWDRWDRTDFGIAHKAECDFCADKEYVFQFPWGFIHNVAKSEHPGTLSFLKKFDITYPVVSNYGSFFTDEPVEGETVYDWTIRHHKRLNLAANRQEMQYVPFSVTNNQPSRISDTGCTTCSQTNGS